MKNMAMIMSTLEADDWFRNPHFCFSFFLGGGLSSIFFVSGGMFVGILGASPMGEPHGRHGNCPMIQIDLEIWEYTFVVHRFFLRLDKTNSPAKLL